MTKIKNFRTRVFKTAHEIRKQSGKVFSICLTKAWEIYRLKKEMTKRTVKFAFEKVDGSIRYAYGILKPIESKISSPNYKAIPYFDVEKNSFRSFRAVNFIRQY